MEHVWNTYGTRMEHVWNTYGTLPLANWRNTYGSARYRFVADPVSGLASTPSNNRVFESTLHEHRRRSWYDGKHFSVPSCRPKCTYGAALAYRCKRTHQGRGSHYPGRGNLIMVTSYPNRDSEPARTRMEEHGAVPPQISSRRSARPHTFVSSEVPYTNSKRRWRDGKHYLLERRRPKFTARTALAYRR